MRNTSQSLRDQIKVVYIGSDIAWNFHVSSRIHWGAFTGVQKIIVAYWKFRIISQEELSERLKGTFGRDAEVVFP
jgi:hypothetical protein